MICFMQIFVTNPHFDEVITYDDAKPIFGETKSYLGQEPPNYDMTAQTRRNKALMKIITQSFPCIMQKFLKAVKMLIFD